MKNLKIITFVIFLTQITSFCSAAEIKPAASEIAVCNLENEKKTPEETAKNKFRNLIIKAKQNKKYIAAAVVATVAAATALYFLLKTKPAKPNQIPLTPTNPTMYPPAKDWSINVYKYFGVLPKLIEEGRLNEVSNKELVDLIEYYNQENIDPSIELPGIKKAISIGNIQKALEKEREARKIEMKTNIEESFEKIATRDATEKIATDLTKKSKVTKAIKKRDLSNLSKKELDELAQNMFSKKTDPMATPISESNITIGEIQEEIIFEQEARRNDDIVRALKTMPAAEFTKEKKEIEDIIGKTTPISLETTKIKAFPKKLEKIIGNEKPISLKLYYELIKNAEKLRK